jgi:hypothetical protein
MKSLWTFVIISFVLVILVIVAIVIARKNAVNAAMLAAQQNGMPLSPPQALGLNQPQTILQTAQTTFTPINTNPGANVINKLPGGAAMKRGNT